MLFFLPFNRCYRLFPWCYLYFVHAELIKWRKTRQIRQKSNKTKFGSSKPVEPVFWKFGITVSSMTHLAPVATFNNALFAWKYVTSYQIQYFESAQLTSSRHSVPSGVSGCPWRGWGGDSLAWRGTGRIQQTRSRTWWEQRVSKYLAETQQTGIKLSAKNKLSETHCSINANWQRVMATSSPLTT